MVIFKCKMVNVGAPHGYKINLHAAEVWVVDYGADQTAHKNIHSSLVEDAYTRQLQWHTPPFHVNKLYVIQDNA